MLAQNFNSCYEIIANQCSIDYIKIATGSQDELPLLELPGNHFSPLILQLGHLYGNHSLQHVHSVSVGKEKTGDFTNRFKLKHTNGLFLSTEATIIYSCMITASNVVNLF